MQINTKGIDFFPVFNSIISNATSSSGISGIFFMGITIIFGLIFFYTNISVNGITKSSMFVGYSVWAWISLLCAIIIIRLLGKFASMFFTKQNR